MIPVRLLPKSARIRAGLHEHTEDGFHVVRCWNGDCHLRVPGVRQGVLR